MFNLTQEESKVVLFLVISALIGTGISFASKTHTKLQKAVSADLRIAKINLNQASLDDLLESRCVSRRLADKIIELRNEHGGLGDFQELKKIKGVKDSRLKKLGKEFFVE